LDSKKIHFTPFFESVFMLVCLVIVPMEQGSSALASASASLPR